MKSVNDLHDEAMDLAEQAVIAEMKGSATKSQALFRRAYALERQAAMMVASDHAAEPSRSVLLRSAASLAIDCKKFREAEQLIALALSGNPPTELCEELRDLLEVVHFERHLKLRGMELCPGELQMSLVGNAIGLGLADSVQFLRRADTIEKLLVRTAERKRGMPFRETATPPQRGFEVYFGVPMAASFAIAVRFGKLERQHVLPTFPTTDVIVSECLTCFEIFSEGDRTKLFDRLEDPAYFNNFVALTRKLAPDGDRIKTVGFTSVSHRKKQMHVALTKPPDPIWTQKETKASVVEVITGTIRAADELSQHRYHVFMIESSDHSPTKIIVPPGMLQDIVKPLWGADVRVTAERRGQQLHLMQIDPAAPANDT